VTVNHVSLERRSRAHKIGHAINADGSHATPVLMYMAQISKALMRRHIVLAERNRKNAGSGHRRNHDAGGDWPRERDHLPRTERAKQF